MLFIFTFHVSLFALPGVLRGIVYENYELPKICRETANEIIIFRL
jgi:hypothetical protein